MAWLLQDLLDLLQNGSTKPVYTIKGVWLTAGFQVACGPQAKTWQCPTGRLLPGLVWMEPHFGDSFGGKRGVTVHPEQMAKASEMGSFIKRSLSDAAVLSC